MAFTNLHTHSMYSLRDSIIRPDDLVERLKEIKQTSIAITDHGSCLGSIYLYKKLKENNIKYIHGCEIYICKDVSIKDKNDRYYHLVLLCKNETGRLNLNRLMSISEHPDNKYYKPRIDFNILSKYKEGLICLSACMAGEVSRELENDKYENAKLIAIQYKNLFGEDYYLEIQSHSDTTQIQLNKKIFQLSKELNIPCVVTCDAHYVKREDKKYQNKYAFNGKYKEDGEAYVDCFIQTEDDVYNILNYFSTEDIEKFIKNTEKIDEKCNLEMPLSAPIMPHIDTPSEFKTNKEWLTFLCKEGFKTKLNINFDTKSTLNLSKKLFKDIYDDENNYIKTIEFNYSTEEIEEYINRFNYELDSLERMGFIDYILLVNSYANIANRRGIARGSGGGSLICYLTNITNIDPIEHRLYFERFIDVGALALLENGKITKKELKIPDIDLDFSGESCLQVLDFLYKNYGEDKVASIGKFGTNQSKGTIRDMCKVLGFSLDLEDEIAKSFENYSIEDIDLMILGEIPTPENAKKAKKYVTQYEELFEYVRKLNGLPKSFGLHACGKVVSTQELDYFLPSCYDSNGVRYLQGDMHDVEDVGLVKIDVLGLRTLDQEYDTLEMSKENSSFIDPKQSFSDQKVLDVFRNGDTVGIFQMSSYGMKQTLKKMNVSGIEDLSVANALYRPGAMQYIDNYCNRKQGKEQFEYLHPDLEPILKNTFSVIVYQEQLIEIGRLAKLHNPDLLRQATGKKDIKKLNKVKPELEEKLLARGWSQQQFDKLWADMLEFAKYSFNKAHSAAYAIMAYMTAKQKAYYPKEFYAGLLNSYIGKGNFLKEDCIDIFKDIGDHKVKINPINFYRDARKCSVDESGVNYCTALIRDCNKTIGDEMYALSKQSYANFVDLLLAMKKSSTINSRQLSTLIKLDFYSDFGNSMELLRIVDIFELFTNSNGFVKSLKKTKISSESPMLEIVKKYSNGKNKDGSESKSYTILDPVSILNECETYIKSLKIKDFDIKNKVSTQMEYLGYISATGNPNDRPTLIGKEVYPMMYKDKSRGQCGYSIITQSVGSGITTRFSIFNSVWKKYGEIKKGDIIRSIQHTKDGGFFGLKEYKIIV